MVATCLATSAAGRCGSTSTLVTSSMRSVTAARWLNRTRTSWNVCSSVYGADGKAPTPSG